MRQLKIPRIRRRAPTIPISRLEKPLGDSKSYHPISQLCNILQDHQETHLHLCRTNHWPTTPAGPVSFQHGRLTADQVTLLTQDIEDSFSAWKKVRAVFVNLIAAYVTVWHCTLTCKLLRLLPERHMILMIIEMVGNHSFTLTIDKCSTSRSVKNGVPQWSIQAPLSNIFTSDLSTIVSRKYV